MDTVIAFASDMIVSMYSYGASLREILSDQAVGFSDPPINRFIARY